MVRYSRFQVLAFGDGEWMVVQLVYANQAGKWCFRGYVVRSLDCPGLWRLCENGDTGCPLHHKGTAKAWEQNDGAIAHRPYHPGHIPSSTEWIPRRRGAAIFFSATVSGRVQDGTERTRSDVHQGSLPRWVETAVHVQGATAYTREGPATRREIPNHYTRSSALLFNQINRFGGPLLF